MSIDGSVQSEHPTTSSCGIPGTGRVLVIEDDTDLRDVLDLLIGIEGCEAQTAPDAFIGLKAAVSWKPDLILLDYSLPGLSGAEFVRAYRATPGPHAPILLLTGREGGAQLAEALGVAGQIPKPFTIAELTEAMAQFVDCSD
jgi:CheY-like chemotaxis protein